MIIHKVLINILQALELRLSDPSGVGLFGESSDLINTHILSMFTETLHGEGN